jgi:hypothetical protein
MEYSEEIRSYLKRKIVVLDEFISSIENTSGVIGNFTSNGEFCTKFELKNKYTPDPRRFFWNTFIKELAKENEIILARNKEGGKNFYIMRPFAFNCFLTKYPKGVKVL